MPDDRAQALCDRLEHYGFECEAGPLRNCVEWRELKELTVNEKKKIGLIAGVFDLVHAGHVLAFQHARSQCDELVVALHVAPTDPSKNQPAMHINERETILRACRYVDDVIVYCTEDELLKLLASGDFDIRFLGLEYWGCPITGGSLSIETRFLLRDHCWSTSELRARVYAAEVQRLGGLMGPAHAVR